MGENHSHSIILDGSIDHQADEDVNVAHLIDDAALGSRVARWVSWTRLRLVMLTGYLGARAKRSCLCLWRRSCGSSGEANREGYRHLGKHAQPARPQVLSGGPASLPGVTRLVTTEAYICRKWPYARYDLLPIASPMLPRFRRGGAGKHNPPKGPFDVIDFLKKIWSGRRDSNPRPQPWQGCT